MRYAKVLEHLSIPHFALKTPITGYSEERARMNETGEEQALLRAILRAPEDDTPRLIYADWLDENAGGVCWRCGGGRSVSVEVSRFEPSSIEIKCSACEGTGTGDKSDGRRERAEFIRVQIELSKYLRDLPPKPDDTFYQWYWELRERELELWKAHSAAWFVDQNSLLRMVSIGTDDPDEMTVLNWVLDYPRGTVCRGFVDEVEVVAGEFCSHDGAQAGTLFLVNPIVRVQVVNHINYPYPTVYPHSSVGSGRCSWWSAADAITMINHPPSDIPDDLFALIVGGPSVGRTSPSGRYYDTRDEAFAALESACLEYGRLKAGYRGDQK